MRGFWVLVGAVIAGCDPGGWKSLESGSEQALRGVFVEAKNRVWIAGEGGSVLFWDGVRFTDNSTAAGYRGVDVPDWYGVAANAGEMAVVGDRGLAFSRRETVWAPDNSTIPDRLLTMFRPAPSIFYAAGEGGRVIRRRLGEARWERVDVNAPRAAKITGGWSNSAQAIALSTDQGIVIELVGDQWVSQTVATSTSAVVPLFGVWSSTRGADLIAVGLAGLAYRRAEGAIVWALEETSSNADLYGVFGSANDRVYAVGSNGTILRYDGALWKGVPSASAQDLFAIHGLADGSYMVAVGDRGTVVVLEE